VQRVITEYEQVVRAERVPVERLVQDYYAVEYQTEYVPRIIEEKVIDYVQQEKVFERVQYTPYETQVVHGGAGYGTGYGAGYGVGAIGVAPGSVQEVITTTTSGPGPYPGAVGVGYGGIRGSTVGLGGVGYGAGYGVGVPTVGVSSYGTGYGAGYGAGYGVGVPTVGISGYGAGYGAGYGVGVPAVGGYGAGYRRY